MKKLLISVAAATLLAGCTYYDYYKGGVRYTQDGDDCVYYADEYGRNFSSSVRGLDGSNRIVYRNTRCEDLFAMDNPMRLERNDRQVLVPAVKPVEAPKCGCNACGAKPVARQFYSFTAK
jgi:hypothetical protein